LGSEFPNIESPLEGKLSWVLANLFKNLVKVDRIVVSGEFMSYKEKQKKEKNETDAELD
jgi:hypothetical protein